MDNGTNNKKNLIIVGAIIVAVGFVSYLYVTRDRSGPEDLLSATPAAAAVSASVDGDLISALSSLRRLRLDDSFFKPESPLYGVWRSLTDFGRILTPQPSGRPNPFAPLEGASASAQ